MLWRKKTQSEFHGFGYYRLKIINMANKKKFIVSTWISKHQAI